MQKVDKNIIFVYLETRVIFRSAFAGYVGVTRRSLSVLQSREFYLNYSTRSSDMRNWQGSKPMGNFDFG
jgi:hypothetical protein